VDFKFSSIIAERNLFCIYLAVFLCLVFGSTMAVSKSAAVSTLLANPEEWLDKEIIVAGYSDIQGSVFRLYMTREDAKMNNFGAAIFVSSEKALEHESLLSSDCGGSFVEIIGVFGVIARYGEYGINGVSRITKIDIDGLTGEEGICWGEDNVKPFF
jgi:hypothetical protein